MKHIRKLIVFAAVICMLLPFCLSADADMWMPPDEEYNMSVVNMAYQGGSCGGINLFLSNYVEANVTSFDSSSSDTTAIAKTMKHLELNAGLFGDKISRFVSDEGQVCMRVSGDLLEERVAMLFGRYIDASALPGYHDGDVIVTADHYGGPIQVFASAFKVSYDGDRVYTVYFDVYKASGSFSDLYRTCNMDLPTDQLEYLGMGFATVRYTGENDATEFYSTDFTLQRFSMDVTGIPCTSPNAPYEIPEPTVPETEAPTEPAQPPMTEAPTQAPETEPEQPTEEEPQKPSPERKDNSNIQMVLLVLLVISCALFAFLVILLVYKKRQR